MAGAIPITGLSMLGQTLLNGADDYVGRQRQLEDAARQRAERLSDIGSQRQYEQQNFDKMRTLQLSDEQRHRVEAIQDQTARAALEARFKMLNEAQARGLIDAAALGNQVAEDAAIKKVAEVLAKESQFRDQQPTNAAARLAELGQAEQQVVRKLSDLEAHLAAQPTIDQNAVQNTAIQMATQMNGGKTPSREQIQQALPDALAKAQQEATIRWYQDKSDAQVQQKLLSDQLNTIRQQQANLTSTFKVAPAPSTLSMAPAQPATPAPAPGGSPIGGFLQALSSSAPAAAPAPSSNLTLGDVGTAMRSAPPSAVPALRQTRTNLLADAYGQLDDPANSTAAKLADVQTQLQRAQSGVNPWQSVNAAPMTSSPQAQGEWITRLILQQSALQRQLAEEQKARSGGRSNLLSGLQLNTPSQVIPVTPPSAGAALSDPYGWQQD